MTPAHPLMFVEILLVRLAPGLVSMWARHKKKSRSEGDRFLRDLIVLGFDYAHDSTNRLSLLVVLVDNAIIEFRCTLHLLPGGCYSEIQSLSGFGFSQL